MDELLADWQQPTGSEMNTASAHYRPGNTNTKLRKGKKDQSIGKTKSSKKELPESSAKQMDPADDSFRISPE